MMPSMERSRSSTSDSWWVEGGVGGCISSRVLSPSQRAAGHIAQQQMLGAQGVAYAAAGVLSGALGCLQVQLLQRWRGSLPPDHNL
jgi:hypothetical protein